jgi:hypothetical protein
LLRHSLDAIEGNEPEKTMQILLGEVPRSKGSSFALPRKFDARATDSRIILVCLSSLRPLNPENEKTIDIADLIEEHDLNAFRKIISTGTEATHHPSNRILLPPIAKGVRKEIVDLINREGPGSRILKSHCIDRNAAELLRAGKLDEFLSCRGELLIEEVESFGSRLAGWDMNDRPSIKYILQKTGEEE